MNGSDSQSLVFSEDVQRSDGKLTSANDAKSSEKKLVSYT